MVAEVYEAMEEKAASEPRKEIGGMLFGSFDPPTKNEGKNGDQLNVQVEQVVHIPPEGYTNSKGYFEIKPEYLRRAIDEFADERTYLGNWHSHLGYGGPSPGDHQQVATFFDNNEFRDYLISIIMDRESLNPLSYVPIIEVYRRKEKEYETRRVQKYVLVDDSTVENPVANVGTVTESGELSGREPVNEQIRTHNLDPDLEADLLNLVDTVDAEIDPIADLSEGLVYTHEGSGSTDAVVVALPVRYPLTRVQNTPAQMVDLISEITGTLFPLGEKRRRGKSRDPPAFPAYVSLTVPFSHPNGEIYIDLATRDLTKQLTFRTVDAAVLAKDREEFVEVLERAIEDRVPALLETPLLSVLQDDLDSQT